MSVNTAHANNGVLIHTGEWILLFSDNIHIEFIGQDNMLFKGNKSGRIYLTTHRIIFNNKHSSDPMQSFSFPFVAVSDIDIEQPVFGANYIKGKVRAQPNGNWTGEVKFKLYFKAGGAIDFGQAMKRAAVMAQRYSNTDAPPPYTPPVGSWYEAPPPAYQAPPGYYGWIPTGGDGYSQYPPPNTVFMSDNPPPYPGISGQSPVPNGYPGYPGAAPSGNYPAFSGNAPAPLNYPGGPQQGGYSAHAGAPGSFSNGSGGYPGAPANYSGGPGGYPGSFQPTGYSGSAPPNMGYTGYPGGAAGPTAMGFTAGPPNSKEAEAAQSAFYDPSRPQTAYVPPPAYYESPPSYDAASKKNM